MRKKLLGAMVVVGLVGALSPVGTLTANAVTIGEEGCTPGYWKNHTSNWEEYNTSTTLGSVFTFPASLSSLADDTFLEALKYGGGDTVLQKAQILLRHAVAAFLNAAHDGVGYPYRRFGNPFNIQAQVNAALASLDGDEMLDLKDVLEDANQLGCPF